MTTQYPDKFTALSHGIRFASRDDIKFINIEELLAHPAVKIVEVNIEQFGYVHEDCTAIEFDSPEKDNGTPLKVRIATTKYRDGFDLWLIDASTGFGVRA